MKVTKWMGLAIGIIMFISYISYVLFFQNDSKGSIAKGQSMQAGLKKQTADDDIKTLANATLAGQSLLDYKANFTAANRKINFYYVNIGGTGILPLYIPTNGALPYAPPSGVTAPKLPTSLQAVAGTALAPASNQQVTNMMTTTHQDYIDPNATYKTVIYTDTATSSMVQILAVQQ